MKTLLLVRHAKSSWDYPDLADIERPLNERGLRNAPEMGRRLALRGVRPDLILSSPAVRALTTARLIAQQLDYPEDNIRVDERIYEAAPETLLTVISELDPALRVVLLVGHNPELTELAQRWTDKIEHMPTAAVAEFAFSAKTWAEAVQQRPRLVWFNTPKQGFTL
ncbi:MAG: histidine phosphatase family protein [Thermoflexales bacterium]|nr:histidine phosphatase family protein [Thermoflexales bacterium]MCS7325348.1 histidine phosphatase family protein [Thermoflexales bacterium]MCX7938039.1 histidine phosphatase family protein [Thermoflexales bacterium]MDW8054426.1 histidine phosphatase family protein [Anaerolineae bacterium]MDW8293448.1 histidine phosphatase family protein [Anaerolineae bacterium]